MNKNAYKFNQINEFIKKRYFKNKFLFEAFIFTRKKNKEEINTKFQFKSDILFFTNTKKIVNKAILDITQKSILNGIILLIILFTQFWMS